MTFLLLFAFASLVFCRGLVSPLYGTMSRIMPGQVTSVVVFGDSLSSHKKTLSITGGKWPIPQYYSTGRYSGSLNYVDYLAAALNVPIYNYAVGGSTTNNSMVQGYTMGDVVEVPDIQQQFEEYLLSDAVLNGDEKPLFVVWAGVNDFFFGAGPDTPVGQLATDSATNVYSLVRRLDSIKAKEKFILVLNTVDFSVVPIMEGATKRVKAFVKRFNHVLYQLLEQHARRLKDEGAVPAIAVVNAHHFLKDIIKRPSNYGIVYQKKPCLEPKPGDDAIVATEKSFIKCPDMDQHLFYDYIHPGPQFHKHLGETITRELVYQN